MTPHRRVEYIDGLRGVAVVAMFFVHAAVAWLAPSVRGSSYWSWSMTVSGMVAPTFLFLAGLSMTVVVDRAIAAGEDASAARARLVRRGAEIVAMGYGLHIAFYALDGFEGRATRVLKVDVLHCIGLSMIAFARLARPTPKPNRGAAAVFLLLPVLAFVTYRLPITTWLPVGLASYLTTRGALALFPFIPYGTWLALGLLVAPHWLAASRDPRKESRLALGLLVVAALAYAAGKGLGSAYHGWSLGSIGIDPITDAPQSRGLVHVFWTKSAFVLVFFALAIHTRAAWRTAAARPLRLFGKRSLFAYGAHLMIIYPLAGPYLARRLLPWQHAALSAALTLLMFGLVVAWVRLDLGARLRRRSRGWAYSLR